MVYQLEAQYFHTLGADSLAVNWPLRAAGFLCARHALSFVMETGVKLSEDMLDQPVWGCESIAEIIRRTPRQTFHLLKRGHLDASRVGGRWVSTRRRLLKHIVGGHESAA